jgi:GTP cyclohydrolase I
MGTFEVVKMTVAHEAIRSIIRLIGDDPDRPGLRDTPARVFRAWKELFAGYNTDPEALLKTFDDIDNDEMIVLRNCNFQSWCEHHMLPFSGVAHVGYLPEKGRVVGLSKLARLVDCFALRLQVQERMTVEIADALLHGVRAKGVGVVVEAGHSCMSCRGVRKPGATMVTCALRGVFKSDAKTRAEFMSLVQSK